MSLFKLLGNILRPVWALTRCTHIAKDPLTMNDRKLPGFEPLSEQVDPACALRQTIRELSCNNDQKLAELSNNKLGLEQTVNRSQTEIQLANWGAEQGNWGQRYAA